MLNDDAAVLDIVKAARKALRFVEGMDRASFLGDEKTQAAVVYQITIIGEAANRTSMSFRLRHSDVPWPLIVGMRNRLIHTYDEVDLHEARNQRLLSLRRQSLARNRHSSRRNASADRCFA